MNTEDWANLNNMHKELSKNHLAAYDTAYLEKYVELLAKSLEGKGDPHYDNRH
jgi:hypothetical protein